MLNAIHNQCLNAVHERVQFTREEEENQSIEFLDVLVQRHDDGSLTTSVHRKPSNTNIGIKPQSYQDPTVVIGAFKGELCRCYWLCTSAKQVKKEIEFVPNLFEDNGHNRQKLKAIADTYIPPSTENNKNNNTNKNNTRNPREK